MPDSQTFFIPGPLPGLNDIIAWSKQHGRAIGRKCKRWGMYAQEKKAWEDMIIVIIQQARIKPVTAPVTIRYGWSEPNRRRDLSNIAAGKKLVEDALVRAGILHNDGWKEMVGFTDLFVVDKKHPGVRVTLMLRKAGS